jgi:serine/threonine protein kinase/uncharacterized membrane protein
LQIGQALHFAHQQQIIHRDLKPANILFNANGHAMLADFGIATLTESARTVSADAIGSPPYMAPEQFDGIVSMKSDQYALGCLAYELFTGSRPFQPPVDPTWFAWRHKHLIEVPPAPTQLNSYLAPSIEQALLKALAKDRLHRHADVATFVMALATPTLSQEYSPTQLPQMPMVSDKPSTTDPEQYKQTSIVEKPSPAEAEPSDKGEISQQKKNVQAEKGDESKQQDEPEPVSYISRNERVMACLAYLFSFTGLIGVPIIYYRWSFIVLGVPIIYYRWPISIILWYVTYISTGIVGIVGIITSLVLFIILLANLKRHFVRYHTIQVLWLSLSSIALYLFRFTSISILVFSIIFCVITILYLILLCIGLRGALQGRNTKLPIIGTWAEKFANKVSR